MTRSREDIVLGETADIIAGVAWTASHRKDNRKVHMKGLKDMSEAYAIMKTAWRGRRDSAAFYDAKQKFDEALETMHADETEPWRA